MYSFVCIYSFVDIINKCWVVIEFIIINGFCDVCKILVNNMVSI